MRCTLCDYDIKNIRSVPMEKRSRRDTVAVEFNRRWLCGDCSDNLQERFDEQ